MLLIFTLPEPCKAYFGNDNMTDFFYRIQWFFGQATTEGIVDLPYIFSSQTTITGPLNNGQILLTNATQTSATKAQISPNDDTGVSQKEIFK